MGNEQQAQRNSAENVLKREDKQFIIVPIKQELSKVLPFDGLQSRNVHAMVLTYLGFKEDVFVVMQKTNHKSRAYIMNAEGLKGFLISGLKLILNTLINSQYTAEIDKVAKWQVCDLPVILGQLVEMPTIEERMEFLRKRYPCLYMYVLRKMGRHVDVRIFMQLC